jgi:hypothetical protein
MTTPKSNTSPLPHPCPTSDRLEQIREADARAGENLQMCPAAWQERRDLLAYINRHDIRWERLEQIAALTHKLCTGQGDSQDIQSRIVRVIRQLFCDHGNRSDSCTHPDCTGMDS